MNEKFALQLADGYGLEQPSVVLGSAMLDDELYNAPHVQVALSMLNRHGLICGATGTGKTKTLQILAGALSRAGVPCFVADIKGDVTGMAAPGDASNPKIVERMTSLGLPYEPQGHPVEFLSLSGKLGAQVRATVHSFGPLLLSKVLDLNDTQSAVLTLVFRYCDDQAYPLLDLKDLVATLKFLASDDGKPALEDYGGISSATVGVLLRQIVVLEQEGADIFFGEPEFDVMDLLRTTPAGAGVVSLLELPDVMDKPRLFSTFMLWMLAQLYETLPEVGDLPQPKLCFFFDEAHLLFDEFQRRADGRDRADGAADSIQGGRRVLRHPGADRRAIVGPVAAGQPRPARAAGFHARGCRRAAQDSTNLPDDRLLRRREDAHFAGHRRGGGDSALATRGPHAARGDEARGAQFTDVADPPG